MMQWLEEVATVMIKNLKIPGMMVTGCKPGPKRTHKFIWRRRRNRKQFFLFRFFFSKLQFSFFLFLSFFFFVIKYWLYLFLYRQKYKYKSNSKLLLALFYLKIWNFSKLILIALSWWVGIPKCYMTLRGIMLNADPETTWMWLISYDPIYPI